MRANNPRTEARPSKVPATMKLLAAAAMACFLGDASVAHAQEAGALPPTSAFPPAHDDVRMVAPALERYAQGVLFGDLRRGPDLTPRDRSLVTLAALIARNQTVEMPFYVDLALDDGVTPGEVSETITHLAFYAGWPNAFSAVPVMKVVFASRPD